MSDKPTREQIDRYITAAEMELGPECEDAYVAAIAAHLREWAGPAAEAPAAPAVKADIDIMSLTFSQPVDILSQPVDIRAEIYGSGGPGGVYHSASITVGAPGDGGYYFRPQGAQGGISFPTDCDHRWLAFPKHQTCSRCGMSMGTSAEAGFASDVGAGGGSQSIWDRVRRVWGG